MIQLFVDYPKQKKLHSIEIDIVKDKKEKTLRRVALS